MSLSYFKDMNDNAAYRRLWSAVVHQAVRDLDEGGDIVTKGVAGTGSGRVTTASRALDWIYSGRQDAGSMFWICDMLDLDYNKLLTLCMTREGRRKILRPNFRFTGTRDATENT